MVKAGGEEPYRPKIFDAGDPEKEHSMAALMQRCWQEDPHDRPEVSYVIKQLQKANGGK